MSQNISSSMGRVALGLSGGVDSAVSAYLLKQQGWEVHGIYLNCYDANIPGCRAAADRRDALAVALHLGIPFQALDFRRAYKDKVIGYFKAECQAGRTPNPDVVCNRDIKFGLFYDWALGQGFDYIATGHYARSLHHSAARSRLGTVISRAYRVVRKTRNTRSIRASESRNVRKSDRSFPVLRYSDSLTFRPSEFSEFSEVSLAQPKDLHKDQTYFLWQVPREKFNRVLFPLGDLLKTEVREIARRAKIPVADKKDSTGICFLGEVSVSEFLKSLGVREQAGDVVVRVCSSENSENSDGQSIRRPDNQIVRNSDSRSFLSVLKNRRRNFQHRHSASYYRVIGIHRGVAFYTIGQRHGFSVDDSPLKNKEKGRGKKEEGQTRSQTGDSDLLPSSFSLFPSDSRPPLYVVDKDVAHNRLVVGFGAEAFREKFMVEQINWLVDDKFFSQGKKEEGKRKKETLVRIRHGGELIPCEVLGDKKVTVRLAVPQRGVAAGQSAVFYSETGIVLGGGIIQ